jgi:hypothetical protein
MVSDIHVSYVAFSSFFNFNLLITGTLIRLNSIHSLSSFDLTDMSLSMYSVQVYHVLCIPVGTCYRLLVIFITVIQGST